MKNKKWINTTCQKYEFGSGNCIIDKDIIRDQAFTNVINFTETNPDFISKYSSVNGNLIVTSAICGKTLKYFYDLKKNGRTYFSYNNEEALFEHSDLNKGRFESNIFGIKLNGTKDDIDNSVIIISVLNIIKGWDDGIFLIFLIFLNNLSLKYLVSLSYFDPHILMNNFKYIKSFYLKNVHVKI